MQILYKQIPYNLKLNNPKMNNRSPSIKGMAISKLSVTLILSLLIFPLNVTAQDFYSSDSTRAARVRAEMEKRGDSGSGSFTGITTRLGNEPVRRVDFFICNHSSHDNISVAHSVLATENRKVTGWINVEKKKCRLIVRRQTHVKYYAFSGKTTWSGKNLLWEDQPLTWVDPYALCVDVRSRFEVVSDLETCPDSYTRVRFHSADLESRDKDKDGRFYLKLKD